MLWPGTGVLIFTIMSGAPLLLALLRRSRIDFAVSLTISLVAVTLARYTYLVPVSIVLLVLSFTAAAQTIDENWEGRWDGRGFFHILVSLAFLLVGAGAAWLGWFYFSHNWGPPEMFEKVTICADCGPAMTDTLNARFPRGSDEALLKSVLVTQGFKEGLHRPICRQASKIDGVVTLGPCPDGTREMVYAWSAFICGARILVNWSVDHERKITRLEANPDLTCL